VVALIPASAGGGPPLHEAEAAQNYLNRKRRRKCGFRREVFDLLA
jgi:hypothetical protein